MINNLGLYSNLFSTNSAATTTSTQVDEVIAKHKEETAAKPEDISSQRANLYLSNRSQKINTISSEFFSGSDFNFNDLASLKTRMYELGLINEVEYAKLTNQSLSDEEVEASKQQSTTSITSYIEDFITRFDESTKAKQEEDDEDKEPIQETETAKELKKALNQAKDIIADVDKAKAQPEFKETLTASMAFINETINTKAFEKMPIKDKVGLREVSQTLELIDKMSPQRLTNEKLNRYIKVAFD